MPWGLIISAVLVAAMVSFVVINELRRDRRDRKKIAKIEAALPATAQACQKQFERKFGRASSELESSFPSLTTTKRGP